MVPEGWCTSVIPAAEELGLGGLPFMHLDKSMRPYLKDKLRAEELGMRLEW
jgi:hypothetical protein